MSTFVSLYFRRIYFNSRNSIAIIGFKTSAYNRDFGGILVLMVKKKIMSPYYNLNSFNLKLIE